AHKHTFDAWIADFEPAVDRFEPTNHFIAYASMHDEPSQRRAALPSRAGGGKHDRAGRQLQIGRRREDHSIVSPKLQQRTPESPQTSTSIAFHAQTATGTLNAVMTPAAPSGCHCSIIRWPGRSVAMVYP